MLILISCAKIMRECHALGHKISPYCAHFSEPRFGENAIALARHISQYDVDTLGEQLKVNPDIAQQNYIRYGQFGGGDNAQLPALFSYHGIVFKSIDPESFDHSDMLYAQSNLRITSFLYGLLRPLDLIEHYRLEGKFSLGLEGYKDLFSYWRGRLTDSLIEDVKASGGVLCNLASAEMKQLFDWKRLSKEVKIVTPEFYVEKGGKLKTVVIYTKIARGLMTRHIVRNRVNEVEELVDFSEDYRFIGDLVSGEFKFIKR